jgi:hypothetical protein
MLSLEQVQSTLLVCAVYYIVVSYFFRNNSTKKNLSLKDKQSLLFKCSFALSLIAVAKLVSFLIVLISFSIPFILRRMTTRLYHLVTIQFWKLDDTQVRWKLENRINICQRYIIQIKILFLELIMSSKESK